jgi:hypothetical protein
MLSLGKYIVIMCLVIYILCTKNVDIKFSAHDTFLEKPSSGTLKIERLESGIIKKCSEQYWLRSPTKMYA